MRVLICGGRTYGKIPPSFFPTYETKLDERTRALKTLDTMFSAYDKDSITIIHGGAEGGDSIADEWAKRELKQHQLLVFKADWQKHKKAAGSIRNKQMLDEGKPDEVWAFPGGNGTTHMMKISKKSNIIVRCI